MGRQLRNILCILVSVVVCVLTGCSTTKTPDDNMENKVPQGAIELKLMIGNDKQWIFDEVQKILDQKAIKVNGKSIYISTEKAGTGEAMEKVITRGADYVGWMPASSTHILWANERWYADGNTKPIVDEDYTTVFLSPTVIAMQESLAKIMGYPNKKIGWQDIYALSTAADGWGMYGKSILNPVRFAHTHPAKSNSGLNALIAAEYAFSGKKKGLSLDDVRTNSDKLKQLEQTIVHYGESTSLMQKKIVEKGPSFIQYAVLYEYMVASMNVNSPGKDKLIAIYPSEGTIWGDVCFTKVFSDNVTDEQSKALDEVKKILLSKEVQTKGMNEYFFRPADSSIPLSNAISVQNGVNPSEPQTTLELPGIDVINGILNDWQTNMKKRANVLFVIDTSGSMTGEPIDNARSAIQNLFDKEAQKKNYTGIDDEDTISLMTFSTDVSDVYTVKGKDIGEMSTIVDSLYASGNTKLYDAVNKAINEHQKLKQAESEKKIDIIVVLSDGGDTSSNMQFGQLESMLGQKEGNLPVIITIGYGQADKDVLESISDKTGGKYYEGNPDTIKKVFEEIKTFF